MPSVLPTAVPSRDLSASVAHEPVLLDEVIELLAPARDAIVVDCTFGAGGHSGALAARLGPDGLLIAIDQDPAARPFFDRLSDDLVCRTRFIDANFADALPMLADEGLVADAVLIDLGVSSMQIDLPERGFSYSRQAPLDMRMNPTAPISAADLVATASDKELTRWFRDYGEERFARAIARAIVRRRTSAPIATTGDLVEVVRSAVPMAAQFAGGHPAKRVFQALRIAVNNELDVLPPALDGAWEILGRDGRLAVIAFHSLEDRIVKRFTRDRTRGCICPPGMPVCGCGRTPEGTLLATRAIRPRAAEAERNPRSRSSRLRGITKKVDG